MKAPKVEIEHDALIMMRNLIMLDGKRELLIAIADDVLSPPQAASKQAPEHERPKKVANTSPNQSEAPVDAKPPENEE